MHFSRASFSTQSSKEAFGIRWCGAFWLCGSTISRGQGLRKMLGSSCFQSTSFCDLYAQIFESKHIPLGKQIQRCGDFVESCGIGKTMEKHTKINFKHPSNRSCNPVPLILRLWWGHYRIWTVWGAAWLMSSSWSLVRSRRIHRAKHQLFGFKSHRCSCAHPRHRWQWKHHRSGASSESTSCRSADC